MELQAIARDPAHSLIIAIETAGLGEEAISNLRVRLEVGSAEVDTIAEGLLGRRSDEESCESDGELHG